MGNVPLAAGFGRLLRLGGTLKQQGAQNGPLRQWGSELPSSGAGILNRLDSLEPNIDFPIDKFPFVRRTQSLDEVFECVRVLWSVFKPG